MQQQQQQKNANFLSDLFIQNVENFLLLTITITNIIRKHSERKLKPTVRRQEQKKWEKRKSSCVDNSEKLISFNVKYEKPKSQQQPQKKTASILYSEYSLRKWCNFGYTKSKFVFCCRCGIFNWGFFFNLVFADINRQLRNWKNDNCYRVHAIGLHLMAIFSILFLLFCLVNNAELNRM